MKDLNTINLPVDNYLLVGSYPLGIRASRDIDIICYYKDVSHLARKDDYITSFEYNGKRVECLLADNDESLQSLLSKYKSTCYELLYILKKGHIIYHGNNYGKWCMHLHDLHWLSHLVEETEEVKASIKLHRKVTAERNRIRFPKLKGVSKEEFFDDAVVKYIHHDRIHEIVKYSDRPMYEKMQKDNSVECHKDLWDNFTFTDKLHTVAEETTVIAIERFLLPNAINHPNKEVMNNEVHMAYMRSLQKVCTNLCTGWFREFAIDNYYLIADLYNKDNIIRFLNEVKELALVNE